MIKYNRIVSTTLLVRESKMHRTQISIPEHQYRFLVDEAKRRNRSISALLREWIDQQMRARQSLEDDPLWDMVGIGKGGQDDVGEEHDRYLAESRIQRLIS